MVDEALFSSDSSEWSTPTDFFDNLNKEWDFNLDPCATKENAKCETYYTKEQDGLKQDWHCVRYNPEYKSPYLRNPGRVFCNPPYGKEIGQWVKKAVAEVQNGNADVVVMLLPARTDTRWFQDYVLPYASEIDFIRGRLKFGGSKNSAPFPSVVVVFKEITDGIYA
jgi:phage N-6-adenine-methyltransferase